MTTASSTGGNGDIIYQLPAMKELGVTDLYLHEPFYHMMRRITDRWFTTHPFKQQPEVDYNMDLFRKQPKRGSNHIMLSIANQFNTSKPVFYPWLNIPKHPELTEPYTAIHLTGRWREHSKVDWRKVKHGITIPIVFVGLQHEWLDFCFKYGDVKWFPTEDIYEMAQVITGAEALYCNQSVSLALAQAMGINYYLDKKPNKTNTLTYKPNEHIL